MANPSAGFGGAGTEVLRRAYVDDMSNSEVTLLTGLANHIYTVLSVLFISTDSSDKLIKMYVDVDLSGTDIFILNEQSLPGKSTFSFNDRLVLTETDKLHAICTTTTGIDIWVSYIDQQLA